MSIRIMSEVWRTDLPTTEKMVLLVIADHASDDGTNAYPSQATIASKASISIRTVQRCVNNLIKFNYLYMTKHAGGSAGCREDRIPHLYTINLLRLRGDNLTTRQRGDTSDSNGVTLAPVTRRLTRPKNHTNEPSLETSNQFDLFWKIYPIKVSKKTAEIAFIKALKITPFETILEGAKRYAGDPNRHPSYTSHPTTWLNQERWSDAPLPTREKTQEEKRAIEILKAEERRQLEEERSRNVAEMIEQAKRNAVPRPANLQNPWRK